MLLLGEGEETMVNQGWARITRYVSGHVSGHTITLYYHEMMIVIDVDGWFCCKFANHENTNKVL